MLKAKLTSILREPLVHFLVAGVVLFALFEANRETEDAARTIVVTEAELIRHVRHRYGRLAVADADGWLRALDGAAYQRIVDEFVSDEALYREAKAMRLDRDDYSARRRLITQLDFINSGFLRDSIELSGVDLEQFYEENRERYQRPATITFAHVFFDRRKHGGETEAMALRQLELLNRDEVSFNGALGIGDRFLYHRYYVNRELEEVASHFSEGMASSLFALAANERLWVGPFRSEHGYHLALIADRTETRYVRLDEAVARVREDATSARVQAELDRIHETIRAGYEVVLAEGVRGRLESR